MVKPTPTNHDTALLERALELVLRCESDLLLAKHQQNPRFCFEAARKRTAHLRDVLDELTARLDAGPSTR